MNTSKKSTYVILCPILALVNTFLGVEIPFWELLQELYFYFNFLWNLLSIALVFFYLDQTFCWYQKTNYAAWYSFLLIASVGNIIISGLTYFYIVGLWGQSISHYPEFFNYDLANYLIWQMAYLFILKLKFSNHKPSFSKAMNTSDTSTPTPPPTDSIPIKKGKEILLFPLPSIYAVILRNGIVYLVDQVGKPHATDFKMKYFEEKLTDINFFRANRQTIISNKILSGFQQIDNRKILLTTVFNVETNLIVSKGKASTFKKWWHQHHTLPVPAF